MFLEISAEHTSLKWSFPNFSTLRHTQKILQEHKAPWRAHRWYDWSKNSGIPSFCQPSQSQPIPRHTSPPPRCQVSSFMRGSKSAVFSYEDGRPAVSDGTFFVLQTPSWHKVLLNCEHCFSQAVCPRPAVSAQSGFPGRWLWTRGKDPSLCWNGVCSQQQPQTSSQETKGQKVTGLGAEGGVATELSQKNAIIPEMMEESLQDWPKESFSLNSGGLRMLGAQSADSSVDPLWSNEDRKAKELLCFINPGAELHRWGAQRI